MKINKTIHVVNLLVEKRKSLGLTQREVGNRMGIAKSNMSRLENCLHSPTLRMVGRYAHAIGVCVDVKLSKL